MYSYQKFKIILSTFILVFLFSLQVEASTFELALDKNITSIKEDINVLVTINSEGQDINTAQAVIYFPTNLLEVVKIDRSDTVFTFWLEEPAFDNEKGTIRFVGGATSGFNAPGLKVMKVSFKVKGSGSGRLGVTDGAITASDGTGTNVYTTSKGLDINIPTTAEFEAVKIERTQKAVTLAKKLPTKPVLDVPFYPDPTKWNNQSVSFQANWEVDSSVTKVGVALNKNSIFAPSNDKEAMSGSKIFPALDDGVWYLHLRVANNVGWGESAHYRIAIDTTPPEVFEIISDDGFRTINPTPNINFTSTDLGSGIEKYVIKLNDKVATSTSQNSYKFDPIPPGIHRLTVSAVDKAGNSTSKSGNLEILPIATPIISYVSRSVTIDGSGIVAGGTSIPGASIIIKVKNSGGQDIFEQITSTDGSGNWNIVINKFLSIGEYYLLVTARGEDMALSLPITSEVIEVKLKPMLVLGGLEITEAWFFACLIIVLLFSFGMGWLSYHNWKGKLDKRLMIASRDVVNILDNTKKDIDMLLKKITKTDVGKNNILEVEYTLKKIKENIEKSNPYIVDNIRKISKK